MGRIAAIDYGKVRIGLALSDPGKILASSLETIHASSTLEETAKIILHTLHSHQPIDKMILGNPLLMNGKEGSASQEVKKLQTLLQTLCDIPIILWDERLTTVQVEKILIESKMKRKKRAQHLDKMAAREILQCFLDSPCNK